MNISLGEIDAPVFIRFAFPLTDADLLRLSRENDPLRLERDAKGELIVMSPSFSEGGGVEAEVVVELALWARSDGRGKTFGPSAGFTLLDSSVRAADAAWVRWEMWNALTAEQRQSFAPICPEFVIEIRSASDRLSTLREKMKMWIANGAELAWLMDPERRAVEVFRAGEAAEIHDNPTSVQGSGPVLGFELVLSRVWD